VRNLQLSTIKLLSSINLQRLNLCWIHSQLTSFDILSLFVLFDRGLSSFEGARSCVKEEGDTRIFMSFGCTDSAVDLDIKF
jgi:hypothetical protein